MMKELKDRLLSTIALLLCDTPVAGVHPDPMFLASSLIITAENDPQDHFPAIKEFVGKCYDALAEAYVNQDRDCTISVHIHSEITFGAEVAFLMRMLEDVYKKQPEDMKEQYTWEELRRFVRETEESLPNEP